MNKSEKEIQISELNKKFEAAQATIAVGFTRIDVSEITALRKKFRDAGVDYRVIKNTLAKLAAKGTDVDPISEQFVGPTALIFGYDDVVAPAKIVHDFMKEKANAGKIEVRGGVVQGKVVDPKQVEALANMPSLDELKAKMLALFNTPAQSMVRLLNTPGSQLAQVIKAKSELAE